MADGAEEAHVPFDLEPVYQELRSEARAVAIEVEPVADEADASADVHPAVLRALRRSRLCELVVPSAYGGRFEDVDPLAVCIVREVLMGTSSHLDALFGLQGIGSYAITQAGSDEQRARWLPQVATVTTLAALALSEDDAGSDLKALKTEVRESHGELVVSGEKTFISNAGAAAFFTVLGREDDGFTATLVPADTPGVSTRPGPPLIAPHVLGTVQFDDVRLPTTARLGPPGGGMELVMATLAVFRVSVAGAAVGLAQAALDEAVRHARQRIQFGRPIARLGPVAAMLADSWTELEAARLLAYRAAARAREDPLAALAQSSMAKLSASEAAGRIVDRCVQVMGRWGLVQGSKIERLYRQARPMRIYEGASEVLRLGIARQLCEEVE